MTDEEAAAARASLEDDRPDNGAIMQFIAAFLCDSGGGGSDGAPISAAAAERLDPEAGQSLQEMEPTGAVSSAAANNSAAAADARAEPADGAVQRLSLPEAAAPAVAADGQAAARGQATRMNGFHSAAGSLQQRSTSADAVASGQFDWAGGFPTAHEAAGAPAAEQLPAAGSSAAADALLSGQFNWGALQSQPPQLQPEPQVRCVGSQIADGHFEVQTADSCACQFCAGQAGLLFASHIWLSSASQQSVRNCLSCM